MHTRWIEHRLICLVFGFTCLTAAHPVAGGDRTEKPTPEATLRDLASDWWSAWVQQNPTEATILGIAQATTIESYDRPSLDAWSQTLHEFQGRLTRLPIGAASHLRLERDRLLALNSREQIRATIASELTPLDPFHGPLAGMTEAAWFRRLESRTDFLAYADWVEAGLGQASQWISQARRGLRARRVTPRPLVRRLIQELRKDLAAGPSGHPLYRVAMFRARELPPEDWAAFDARWRDLYGKTLRPASLQLLAFAEDEYLHEVPVEPETAPVPGVHVYQGWLRLYLDGQADVDSLHHLGEVEIEKARKEIAEIRGNLPPHDQLAELADRMRSDPQYRGKSASDVFKHLERAQAQARARAEKMIAGPSLPACRLFVTASEFEPILAYHPADLAGNPASLWINLDEAERHLAFERAALMYALVCPGCHTAASQWLNADSIPRALRFVPLPAFTEGWSAYAERVGAESGGYPDSLQRFGWLNRRLARAALLVIDTGIHGKGWSRERALAVLMENVAYPAPVLSEMVDRVIGRPGRYAAACFGEQQFLRLREAARERLGDRFDLATFNEALIADGPMPFDLLERKMRLWMDQQ